MLKGEIIQLLEQVPAFGVVSGEEIERLAGIVALEYFPRGTHILEQDGPPSQFFYLIKKGGVKVFVGRQDEAEIVIDYRTEGDYFGLISVVSGDRPRATVAAVEDTLAYVIRREDFLPVLERNPSASQNLLRSYFTHFIDKTYEETRKRFESPSNGHRRLFSRPLGELVRGGPVTASTGDSIQTVAQRMAERSVGSVVLVGDTGKPAGIVTDRDLREKVVARGKSYGDPVSEIMSSPLISLEAREPCSEALFRMMDHGIHHILVVEGDALQGVVSDRDFLTWQGSAPTMLIKEIRRSGDPERLREAYRKLPRVVSSLAREGAKAFHVLEVITGIVEKLVTQAVDLMEREHGPAPVPYTLFMFGDGGRGELTLDFRLDLGIAHAEAPDPAGAADYFQRLRGVIGEPLCTGERGEKGCPAPENVLDFDAWRRRFGGWGADPTGGVLRPEFLEMRAIRGDVQPVEKLRIGLADLLAASEPLGAAAAGAVLERQPPLGFFRRFVVEKSGEHRNELDLFENGVRPLVDAIRLLALDRGCRARTTRERIEALKSAAPPVARVGEAERAIEYLLTLLIHHQVARVEEGMPADSFVNPEKFTHMERNSVKEAFQLTHDLLDLLRRRVATAEG